MDSPIEGGSEQTRVERTPRAPSVFISYCWADKEFVDRIERAFSPDQRACLVRDIRDAKDYTSIKHFMRKIGSSDYVILVVSDAYMKSRNCMYEILELLKNDDFSDHIFPVIVKASGLDIYSDQSVPAYIAYWKNKADEIQVLADDLGPAERVEVDETLRVMAKIRMSIGAFVAALQDLKSPSVADLEAAAYGPIRKKIWPADRPFDPVLLKRCLLLLSDEQIAEASRRHSTEDADTFGHWLLRCLWSRADSTWRHSAAPSLEEAYKLYLAIIDEMKSESEFMKRIADNVIGRYRDLVVGFFEGQSGRLTYGYDLLKDPKLDKITGETVELMNILQDRNYFPCKIFSPSLLLACCKFLAPETDISTLIRRHREVDGVEFGRSLLGRFTWRPSGSHRFHAGMLCDAFVLREIGVKTKREQEVRDAYIAAIQDSFDYDWEFNDLVQEQRWGLIHALLIIGDEVSLKALAARFPAERDWEARAKRVAAKWRRGALKIENFGLD